MSEELVISLGRDALLTALLVAGPLLGLSLLVGLVVSIFQATTQIQDQTLAFVPKIVAVLIGIVVFGPWMLQVLTQFTLHLFAALPTYLR
ncbi:MAG TPA: flagellar biosynthesis protein FliQ [Firmicutes bacterium]|uniref:flagellar biosynthesis protein FliQ n=1 Tax=Gelria sp. Kuro-4 TaxID=2796927 RepID=UPI0019A383B4|nr:flagellar biosynthesis protein FliQ [Gelria sp. Kuro-4]MDI3521887.1 flagellar biosynthesis protein FliQ [Bacillota bacterium]MDK2926557.1 flagellar biosynthesis protein FliQ [Bacillota bacterium]BCV24938.1 flagellar biosynthetic protein FliQ [Gelria sp. Kuro-4]HHV56198.1 flagellar biosynthesis protein FliQ [Bacillota bacterium]